MPRIACVAAGLALAAVARADEVHLRDGTIAAGSVAAVTATTLELDRCGVRESYLRSEVASVAFAAGTCGGSTRPSPAGPATGREVDDAGAGLPPGTAIAVTLRAPIDSGIEPVGQVFAGRVREAVLQGPRVLLRQGAPVLMQLRMDEGGGAQARPSLWLTAIGNGPDWLTLSPALELDVARTRTAPGAQQPAGGVPLLAGPRLVLPVSAPLVFVSGHDPEPDRRVVAIDASVQ